LCLIGQGVEEVSKILDWSEDQSVLQMIRYKVRTMRGHRDRGVAQDFLQGQNIVEKPCPYG